MLNVAVKTHLFDVFHYGMLNVDVKTHLFDVFHDGMLNVDVKTLDVLHEGLFLLTLHGTAQDQQQRLPQLAETVVCSRHTHVITF